MIGILIITHGGLGDCLLGAATHVMCKPSLATLNVRTVAVQPDSDRPALEAELKSLVNVLNDGTGVLVFSDIYGATPSNLAASLLTPGRVEGFAGVNLPMLVRALSSREQTLSAVVTKLKEVAGESVVYITSDCCNDYSRQYKPHAAAQA